MNALFVAVVLAGTSTPKVGAFSALEVGNGFEVQVAPGATAVKIDADDEVLTHVEAFVKGDVLVLRLKDDYRLEGRKVTVALASPVLDRVSAGGGAKVRGVLPAGKDCRVGASGGAALTLKLECGSLSADASGGSHIDAQGTAATVWVNASGGAQVGLGTVKAASVSADASGGTQIHVHASADLKASLSGGSQLFVAGKPAGRKVETSGGSRVIDE